MIANTQDLRNNKFHQANSPKINACYALSLTLSALKKYISNYYSNRQNERSLIIQNRDSSLAMLRSKYIK